MTAFLTTTHLNAITLIGSTIGVIVLLFSASELNAQESTSNTVENQATYIDGESQSAADIISALKPKPRYKTRGIRFNNTSADVEPITAPTIAMGINFDYDSDQLSDQAIAQLKPLGEALNSDQLANFSFKIDGHTDATGPENYNMDLSRRRALSVGQHLYQAYGVKVERLTLNGKGEAELYDSSKPADGINRRVEITTLVQ